MNLDKIKEKPIFSLTGAEFILLQRSLCNLEENKNDTLNDTRKYAYGIRGISKIFDCSVSTANRIKKSGVIDEAIIQNGRKIIIDVDQALELIKNSK